MDAKVQKKKTDVLSNKMWQENMSTKYYVYDKSITVNFLSINMEQRVREEESYSVLRDRNGWKRPMLNEDVEGILHSWLPRVGRVDQTKVRAPS